MHLIDAKIFIFESDDDDDNISEDQNEKVQTDEKQSLISLLVALLEKLKQTSKCIAPEKLR